MRVTIEYKNDYNRACPVCDGTDFERLSDLEGMTMGRTLNHHLHQTVSICKKCGFILASPTISQEKLNSYYQDQITYFHAEDTYSVSKRISLMEKYAQKGVSVIEFGGNAQGKFREKVEESYKYQSYDVNLSAKNDVRSPESLSVADMIVSYYVFEHIVDLGNYIRLLRSRLAENGTIIIEVPDAHKYYREACSLYATEHVNHFTPESLTKLMARHGFELLEINRRLASRDFGFVGVYQKTDAVCEKPACISHGNFLLNKSIINEGIEELNTCRRNFSQTVRVVHKLKTAPLPGGGVCLWCASNLLESLLAEYKTNWGEANFLIIDEDPRKKEFDLSYKVMTSQEAFDAGAFSAIKDLVILSYERKDAICGRIRSLGLDTINLHVVDQGLSLISIEP